MAENTWKCEKCGKENKENTAPKFCNGCGAERVIIKTEKVFDVSSFEEKTDNQLQQESQAAFTKFQPTESIPDGDGWRCKCGTINEHKFCSECGAISPDIEDTRWKCSKCGEVNNDNYCFHCGTPKQDIQEPNKPIQEIIEAAENVVKNASKEALLSSEIYVKSSKKVSLILNKVNQVTDAINLIETSVKGVSGLEVTAEQNSEISAAISSIKNYVNLVKEAYNTAVEEVKKLEKAKNTAEEKARDVETKRLEVKSATEAVLAEKSLQSADMLLKEVIAARSNAEESANIINKAFDTADEMVNKAKAEAERTEAIIKNSIEDPIKKLVKDVENTMSKAKEEASLVGKICAEAKEKSSLVITEVNKVEAAEKEVSKLKESEKKINEIHDKVEEIGNIVADVQNVRKNAVDEAEKLEKAKNLVDKKIEEAASKGSDTQNVVDVALVQNMLLSVESLLNDITGVRMQAEKSLMTVNEYLNKAKDVSKKVEAIAEEIKKMLQKSGTGTKPVKGIGIIIAVAAAVVLAVGGYLMSSDDSSESEDNTSVMVEQQPVETPEEKAAREAKEKAAKQEEYRNALMAANAERQETANKEDNVTFLATDVKKLDDKNIEITGVYYNGKSKFNITMIKSVQLSVDLFDGDNKVASVEGYECTDTGAKDIRIAPGNATQPVKIKVPMDVSGVEFDHFDVRTGTVHGSGKKAK